MTSAMVRPSFQMLADDVQHRLSPGRFLHVLGVTHTAVHLAMRHGADPELAAVAGLLHDRSKGMQPDEIRADLERRGQAIPEEDLEHPAVWHGLHAAAVLRQDYEMKDEEGAGEVCAAVAVHTTADREMTTLAKILFVADYTEPGRDFEGLTELRALSRKDLDEAFKSILVHKCGHVISRGRSLSPRAQRALEFYRLKLEALTG
jgi:predicted HD superfamily hydrolase involved in NAD metabolism